MKSDVDVLADVHAELHAHGADYSDVVVEARNGVVTLAGHVSSYANKLAAEVATKKIVGVRGIANDIDVRPTVNSWRSDRDIAAAAEHALKSNVSVPPAAVTVLVADGQITLEGEVALWYQKDAAETAVSSLWGVKGVTNRIALQSSPIESDIQQKIQQRFERLVALEGKRITIGVLDGEVTLDGEVDSWCERDDAADAAWSAPGVKNVRNLLTVRASPA